ncbi:hypothetical protein K504DRAFT_96212 [Pleomassaria siparia CBS 279.74]|uniref:Uncharacterized protein n=1 Tax=Pleomassaria siparia CBS 279.74 TaxID=1314801 RepID=A0A6G1JY69_9PLEO|nr:hypothetical protein K504DRAFT_96212 [Pleomassaria siparia CBS 279.74]
MAICALRTRREPRNGWLLTTLLFLVYLERTRLDLCYEGMIMAERMAERIWPGGAEELKRAGINTKYPGPPLNATSLYICAAMEAIWSINCNGFRFGYGLFACVLCSILGIS